MQVKDATGDTTRLLVVGDSQRGEYAPLVALWLRVTQIVFHHADEGAAQVLVWDRTDPGVRYHLRNGPDRVGQEVKDQKT